MCGLS